jgi:hypothetical protein
MEIVNGFPCYNCTDVDYALKHVDPATGRKGLVAVQEAEATGKTEKLATADADNAEIAAGQKAAKVAPAPGVNEPLAAGDRGTKINILI